MQDGRATARPESVTAGDLDTGARIGRYVIIERVGTGAMGVVYGAYDPELDRKVALKLIKPGQGVKDTARARLLREAKAIARLQHPNVVAVHDVGIIDDQVFLAMEFVAGGTIKSWLAAKPRSWREILDVFIAAGRGLAAAHAAGLVHRDFKPDNVLLDKEHRPRVVDFGIARQAGGGEDELAGETGDVISQDGTETLRDSSGKHAFATLTKTGTWVGTPAYMAPEQFLGERGDEKSDQFSFCVALYEALYGERPFAGDDMLTISVNVTTEQLRPLPKDRGIPTWLRRVITRGLRATPSERWDGMPALIAALSTDPVAKLRNRLIAGGIATVVALVLIGAWQMVSRRRAEAEREIARYVAQGHQTGGHARAGAGEVRALRARAFAAFDALDRDDGELLWRQVRGRAPDDRLRLRCARSEASRAAFTLDQSRKPIGQRARRSPLRAPAVRGGGSPGRAGPTCCANGCACPTRTGGGARRSPRRGLWTLSRRRRSACARLLERYERDPATGAERPSRWTVHRNARSHISLLSWSLPPEPRGSRPGARQSIRSRSRRGESRRGRSYRRRVDASVPKGFVYVPAGEFWYGDIDEQLRTQFLSAVPIHRRQTGALPDRAARDDLSRLDRIPRTRCPQQSDRLHAPQVTVSTRGSVSLTDGADGWQLTFQTATQRYVARLGESLRYRGRNELARQDWMSFPVAGVSSADAQRYFAWLRRRDRCRAPGSAPSSNGSGPRAAPTIACSRTATN